jgi:hypothetical protein
VRKRERVKGVIQDQVIRKVDGHMVHSQVSLLVHKTFRLKNTHFKLYFILFI